MKHIESETFFGKLGFPIWVLNTSMPCCKEYIPLFGGRDLDRFVFW